MSRNKGSKVSEMNDFTVKVSYRGNGQNGRDQWTYSLQDYADMMKRDLLRVIMDVEDVIYTLSGATKDEWDGETMAKFLKIRHKLLDHANSIERLPQNLYYKNRNCISSGAMMGRMLDEMLKK